MLPAAGGAVRRIPWTANGAANHTWQIPGKPSPTVNYRDEKHSLKIRCYSLFPKIDF